MGWNKRELLDKPTEVRKESYEKSKPEFSKQERAVIFYVASDIDNAWEISKYSSMLITSVRRALNNLVKKKVIEVTGKVFHKETNRNVTTYKYIK